MLRTPARDRGAFMSSLSSLHSGGDPDAAARVHRQRLDYRRQLDEQVNERRARKEALDRERRERERREDEEMRSYQPFGKQGGGAPNQTRVHGGTDLFQSPKSQAAAAAAAAWRSPAAGDRRRVEAQPQSHPHPQPASMAPPAPAPAQQITATPLQSLASNQEALRQLGQQLEQHRQQQLQQQIAQQQENFRQRQELLRRRREQQFAPPPMPQHVAHAHAHAPAPEAAAVNQLRSLKTEHDALLQQMQAQSNLVEQLRAEMRAVRQEYASMARPAPPPAFPSPQQQQYLQQQQVIGFDDRRQQPVEPLSPGKDRTLRSRSEFFPVASFSAAGNRAPAQAEPQRGTVSASGVGGMAGGGRRPRAPASDDELDALLKSFVNREAQWAS